MGNPFTSSAWLASIELIDRWLPLPDHADSSRKPSGVVQLFTHAGWLNRPAAHNAFIDPAPASLVTAQVAPAGHPRHVRVLRTRDTGGGCRHDARLVISGRINDVCAELDRLASLETRQTPHG